MARSGISVAAPRDTNEIWRALQPIRRASPLADLGPHGQGEAHEHDDEAEHGKTVVGDFKQAVGNIGRERLRPLDIFVDADMTLPSYTMPLAVHCVRRVGAVASIGLVRLRQAALPWGALHQVNSNVPGCRFGITLGPRNRRILVATIYRVNHMTSFLNPLGRGKAFALRAGC